MPLPNHPGVRLRALPGPLQKRRYLDRPGATRPQQCVNLEGNSQAGRGRREIDCGERIRPDQGPVRRDRHLFGADKILPPCTSVNTTTSCSSSGFANQNRPPNSVNHQAGRDHCQGTRSDSTGNPSPTPALVTLSREPITGMSLVVSQCPSCPRSVGRSRWTTSSRDDDLSTTSEYCAASCPCAS